jgi:hypothetical protein
MPRAEHPDEGMVYACPECNNAPVYRRVQDNTTLGDDEEFACYECSTAFDEPKERKTKKNRGGKENYHRIKPEVREYIESQ